MKNLGKNGRNDFPLFPVPRISRSRGGTISGTTRKKPLCRKRSTWNARPHKEVFLASFGVPFRSQIFTRGGEWNGGAKK
jgi:hypothetical protein